MTLFDFCLLLRTPMRQAVLQSILCRGGAATIAEIAGDINCTQQAVGSVLRHFARAGLVACEVGGKAPTTLRPGRPGAQGFLYRLCPEWVARLSHLELLFKAMPSPPLPEEGSSCGEV